MKTEKNNHHSPWMAVTSIMVLLATLLASGCSDQQPQQKSKTASAWEGVPTAERLKVLRAAEIVARRNLAERVYGFQLSSGSTVCDFALASETINNKLQLLLKGASETKDPSFDERGIVTAHYGIRTNDIVEVISKGQSQVSGVLKNDMTTVSVSENNLIEADGYAALPNSRGMILVRSRRAAELDAFRKIAERFVGVKIDSSTTVGDFCLKSDKIQTTVTAFLKGLKPTQITFYDDGSCDVSLQLRIIEVIETVDSLVRTYESDGKVTKKSLLKLNRDFNEKTFTVIGKGAPKVNIKAPTVPVTGNPLSTTGIYAAPLRIIRKLCQKTAWN